MTTIQSGPGTIPRTFYPACVTEPDCHRTFRGMNRSGMRKKLNIPHSMIQNNGGFVVPGDYQWL
ncbi:MAG: hypothetical protein STSR0009_11860 [Methanoregula sp.]